MLRLPASPLKLAWLDVRCMSGAQPACAVPMVTAAFSAALKLPPWSHRRAQHSVKRGVTTRSIADGTPGCKDGRVQGMGDRGQQGGGCSRGGSA